MLASLCSHSESASEPDEEILEPELDPGVELPPDIAEASKQSWLYRSSKSPPNRAKSPSATKKSSSSRREADSTGRRRKSPSPVQPRIRVSRDCCNKGWSKGWREGGEGGEGGKDGVREGGTEGGRDRKNFSETEGRG